MGLLVAAFPELSDKDFNWLQDFRKKNDRYYNILNPHFTIVFPVYEIKEREFIEHVKKTTCELSEIEFTLCSAVTVKDSFSDFWDVLLTPDEGNSRIRKMHDALYTGLLITHLRLDIPYLPHMTVGNDIDPYYSFNMAKEINNADIAIKGMIKSITIASYDGKSLEKIEDIRLK